MREGDRDVRGGGCRRCFMKHLENEGVKRLVVPPADEELGVSQRAAAAPSP